MKFLCQLQTLLDFLSDVAGQCRPYCESGLQAAAVFAELNKEVSVSSFSFQAPHGRSALQFAAASGSYEQSLSGFGSKQQSPMNKIRTSVHVLCPDFVLKKESPPGAPG